MRVSKFRIPHYNKVRKIASWEDLVFYGDQALTNNNEDIVWKDESEYKTEKLDTKIFLIKKIISVASDDTLHLNFEKEAPDASSRETIESIKVLMGLLESI